MLAHSVTETNSNMTAIPTYHAGIAVIHLSFSRLLLPARASEQGNVIGLVSMYIYILYIYIYVIKKNCN